MRKHPFIKGDYYHIFTRKINKERMFLNDNDYLRMLFAILFFQSPKTLDNPTRAVKNYKKRGKFGISIATVNKITSNKYIELIQFALMPNHIHILARELKDGGITKYMQRTLTSYSKYFNTKHKRTGHLFESPFKSVPIKNNNQLLYLSTYIHKQPRNLKTWKNREEKYPWSSYKDYVDFNRWPGLVSPDIIMDQFNSVKEYKKFVEVSIAKDKTVVLQTNLD